MNIGFAAYSCKIIQFSDNDVLSLIDTMVARAGCSGICLAGITAVRTPDSADIHLSPALGAIDSSSILLRLRLGLRRRLRLRLRLGYRLRLRLGRRLRLRLGLGLRLRLGYRLGLGYRPGHFSAAHTAESVTVDDRGSAF